MEGEIIFLGFMMLIGQIILMQMWQSNWFKKENFKIQKANIMAQNKLNLKKLEKELGLAKGSSDVKESASITDNLGGILQLLKGLEPDQISALADRFLNPEELEGSPVDGLLDFATKNPDVVKGFLEGLGSTKPANKDTGY